MKKFVNNLKIDEYTNLCDVYLVKITIYTEKFDVKHLLVFSNK